MQCLRICFTIWTFAISVNKALASPVDILNVDNKNVGDLNVAESNQDDAVISERDNEVGYLRKEDEKGADAYQHFESFHDKDGDAYGYEKHEAYGKSNKGESLNDEKDKNEGSHYNYVQELGDKPKYQKYHGSIDDPGKSKQSNYHYSYNSEDDDETKPSHSSSYQEEAKKDDSSEGDDDEEEEENDVEADDKGTDEEKSTNFSYKIISDDYEDEDANGDNGDINSKGNGNGGYHFGHGHGDKNTDVDYNTKKSDYSVGDDNNDVEGEEEGSDEVDEGKDNDNQEKDKNTNSYSTYTTYNSQEGNDDEENSKDNADNFSKAIPEHAVRYVKFYPIKDNRESNTQKFAANSESEKNGESDDDDDGGGHDDDVVLHQPAKPLPTKSSVLVKEHRAGYKVQNDLPKSTTAQVIIQPSKPIVHVQQYHDADHAGYKVEESDGGETSDDSGKGHAGSVMKHLYEIYVTHDTGKSNGNGDSKGSDDAEGDGKGKSENLVLEHPQAVHDSADINDSGAYKVNVNYGKTKGQKKIGGKKTRKHKGSLKKKKILKPHKYEVEEHIDNGEKTKQPIVAGKDASPQHHRDSEDYSNGQQFVFASEADSDAYYW